MANKPDYKNIDKADAKENRFPVQVSGEYRVYIEENAYERMKKHTSTTSEVELCGVLIGNVHRDSNGFFLLISAIIEGKDANNYGAQVTFTHQTWEHINPIKDRDYPKDRIVGWYHTHPGFGVFLSGMDVFIQENYFNHPYQVAIVVETKQNTEGCFVWVDGKSTPISRYWVGNREIALATGPAEKFDIDKPTGVSGGAEAPPRQMDYSSEPYSRGPGILTMLMMVILFFCGTMVGKMTIMHDLRSTTVSALESEMYSLLEFATMNTAASQDFADIKTKLTEVSQKLEQKDSTAASNEIKALSTQLDEYQKAYQKRRSTLRNDLSTAMNKKRHLSERVEAGARHQDQLDLAVAHLYVTRAADILSRSGAAEDLSQLKDPEKQSIKICIDRAVTLAPEVKNDIEAIFPKMLEALYSSKPPESGAAQKPPAEGKTN
jgi:proteasome lid subunit RPN8/RPN11